jgi:hypothetical protein
MARSKLKVDELKQPKNEVFRVIDDGDRVITTADPYKALHLLQELIEKHNVNACWVDFEIVE